MQETKSLFEFEGVVAHIKACIFAYFLVYFLERRALWGDDLTKQILFLYYIYNWYGAIPFRVTCLLCYFQSTSRTSIGASMEVILKPMTRKEGLFMRIFKIMNCLIIFVNNHHNSLQNAGLNRQNSTPFSASMPPRIIMH